MAEMKGKLCTCDRCGKMVFRKLTGHGEAAGGFTQWDKFEAYPNDWELHTGVGMLCPECNQEYKRMVEGFVRAGKTAKPCDCYHEENGKPVCWGTKEREACSCKGNPIQCDFYPENRRI